jgi:hypothetical protein
MRFRHNKKRNTAFIYEALVREMTKAVVEGDATSKNNVVFVLKKHFKKDSILKKELELYRTLSLNEELELEFATKLLEEAKRQYNLFDKSKIFDAQSALIKDINRLFSGNVFANFIPDYKKLATAYQVFNNSSTPKDKLMLEEGIIKKMSSKEAVLDDRKVPSNNLVYKMFVEKYNQQYKDSLLKEQKELLNKYITSFADSGIELKIYLNEEISRLRESLKSTTKSYKNTEKVLETIDNFKQSEINSSMVEKILKIQSLSEEIQKYEN